MARNCPFFFTVSHGKAAHLAYRLPMGIARVVPSRASACAQVPDYSLGSQPRTVFV